MNYTGLGVNTAGTPLPNFYGFTGTTQGVPQNTNTDPKNYGSWNGDWRAYLEYMADHGDAAAQDKLFNYLMSENSSQIAREWTAKREDTQYQRLVDDLKAAGINPYALLTGGASPISSSSSGNSYSGSYSSNYEMKEKSWYVQMLKVGLSMLPVVGSLIAALI